MDAFLPRMDSPSLDELSSSNSSSSLVSERGLFSLSYISFSSRSSPAEVVDPPPSIDPRRDPGFVLPGNFDRAASDRCLYALSISITLPLSVISLLEDLRVEVARLRGLDWSHRFRGDMERANREDGTRESNDDPRDVLRRTEESRPLANPGRPTLRSKPDIMADFGRLPCFSA